ncbi:MAG TPA: hypothetical protein VNZ64_13720 [Candidatus Acidoferrum sp.]|jgi:hypothetical protein|nr:hypothetical protein [Candidatus Acidoferrum sp.]
MKNDPLSSRFHELAWRRKLSQAEAEELRVWLAAHPEAQEDWEAEAGLSEALDRLPSLPVASNFTAGVLQAVEREHRAPRALPRWRKPHWWMGWLPRAAAAGLVISAVIIGVQHHKRVEDARTVAMISNIPSLPGPAILENFDTIHGLDPGPAPDEDLLKAFQ